MLSKQKGASFRCGTEETWTGTDPQKRGHIRTFQEHIDNICPILGRLPQASNALVLASAAETLGRVRAVVRPRVDTTGLSDLVPNFLSPATTMERTRYELVITT